MENEKNKTDKFKKNILVETLGNKKSNKNKKSSNNKSKKTYTDYFKEIFDKKEK